jgi:hypothetical protein
MDATLVEPKLSMLADTVENLKKQLSNLETKLKDSGLSDLECKKHPEFQELESLWKQKVMAQPRVKHVSKGKGKKKSTESIAFGSGNPGVLTNSARPYQAPDSEDNAIHEEGPLFVAEQEECARNGTIDLEIAVETRMKRKTRPAGDSSSGEVDVATQKKLLRSIRMNCSEDPSSEQKARQAQSRAQKKQSVESYRRKNQAKHDKKRSGDREFKNFQQAQACS